MVAGLTLTSCGGGGGNTNGAARFFAGTEYTIEGGSSGEMTLTFDEAVSPDGQFIGAQAVWNDDANTSTSCRVQVTDVEFTDNRISKCTLTFYGFDAKSVSDAHVLVFYGLATNDANTEGTQSIGTTIYVQGPIGQINQPANALMYTQYVKFGEDQTVDENDTDGDGVPNDDDPAPDDITIVPVIVTRER